MCRYIGISGNTASNMARVLTALDVDTCLIAFNYDLIWRNARTQVMPLAREKGVALILGAIFQYGRFTHVRRDWLEASPKWMTEEVHERFTRLYKQQASSGMSLVELTVRFLLADAGFSTILIGAVTASQLEESVAAGRRGPLSADLHAQVEALGLEEAA